MSKLLNSSNNKCRICTINLKSIICTQEVCARCCDDLDCVRHKENKLYRKQNKFYETKKESMESYNYWKRNKSIGSHDYCKLCIVRPRNDYCNKKLCDLCCSGTIKICNNKQIKYNNILINRRYGRQNIPNYKNYDDVEELILILNETCEMLPLSTIDIIYKYLDCRELCNGCSYPCKNMKKCVKCDVQICKDYVRFKKILCDKYNCYLCRRGNCDRNNIINYCTKCYEDSNKCSNCGYYNDDGAKIYECKSCNINYCIECCDFEHKYSKCYDSDGSQCKDNKCSHVHIIKSLCHICKQNINDDNKSDQEDDQEDDQEGDDEGDEESDQEGNGTDEDDQFDDSFMYSDENDYSDDTSN
jgi:hypothetical protein